VEERPRADGLTPLVEAIPPTDPQGFFFDSKESKRVKERQKDRAKLKKDLDEAQNDLRGLQKYISNLEQMISEADEDIQKLINVRRGRR